MLAADALTLLFGLAAFHAAVLGGFQIPGLSVRNPWRPLVLALAVGGLRVGLTHKASLYRWFRSIGGHLQSDGRAAAPHERRADAIFFRTLDLLVVWVVSVSYVSIALLALDAYDATTAVIAGIIVTTVVRFFTPARLDSAGAGPSRPILPVLLLVLLAALLFRTDPFRTMHGGQDQGLYVSMSGYLQREGKVFIDDPLPGVLPDRQLREIYGAGQPAEPSFGAAVQPGVYYSHTQGDYVFQFYHLHSLWMATFADLFGDGARFYALTFFGLLSVLGLCLLTLELSGSRSATMAVGLLLAVNPLHAFFSRFPVTEVVALAFSSLGIYYLVRAFRGMRNASPAGTTASVLVLATGCVSLVFFVRITGFLYLPALVPLFGFGAWAMLGSREIRGRQLVGFCSVVAVMYGVSVLYGLRYSPVYSLSIYNRTFGGALGEGWPLVTLGAAVLTVTALAAVAWNRHRTPVRRLLDWAVDPRPWTWLATTLVAGAVLGSVYQAYLIGFTERYADNAFYARFDIIGIGADIFLQSGAAAWLLYVSPLLVVALIWGMHRPDRPSAAVLLYVFLAVCLAANLVLNVPVIYRHYYYARYLISEVVPYSLVLAVAVIAHAGPGTFRRLGVLAILATMPFHLFFTTKQMPVRYGSRPYSVLTRIADRVGDGVLLLDVERLGSSRLRTPLNLYFGTHVFPYATRDLDEIVRSFEGALDTNLWLLTNAPSDQPGLRLVETFAYRDQRMDGARTIPVTVNERYWPQVLYLYRQPSICETPGCELLLDDDRLYAMGNRYIYVRKMLGPGWHRPEVNHVWSGRQPTLTLSRTWFASGRWPAALRLEMRPFAVSPDHHVRLSAETVGVEHVIGFDDGATAVHDIPLDCPTGRGVCTVQLSIEGARSPREVYGEGDERTLGIALYRIGFRF